MVNSRLIGERVREARINAQLSQDDLTEQLGIRQSMISQVENGIKIPMVVPVITRVSLRLRGCFLLYRTPKQSQNIAAFVDCIVRDFD